MDRGIASREEDVFGAIPSSRCCCAGLLNCGRDIIYKEEPTVSDGGPCSPGSRDQEGRDCLISRGEGREFLLGEAPASWRGCGDAGTDEEARACRSKGLSWACQARILVLVRVALVLVQVPNSSIPFHSSIIRRYYRLVEHLDQGAFGSWSCAHLMDRPLPDLHPSGLLAY